MPQQRTNETNGAQPQETAAQRRRRLQREQRAAAQQAQAPTTETPETEAAEEGTRPLTTIQRVRIKADRLQAMVLTLLPYARRYADGRMSDAPGEVNDVVRALQEMGVEDIPDKGDGTIWARDAMGRTFDGLTAEQAAQGEEPGTQAERWTQEDMRERAHGILRAIGDEPTLPEAAATPETGAEEEDLQNAA